MTQTRAVVQKKLQARLRPSSGVFFDKADSHRASDRFWCEMRLYPDASHGPGNAFYDIRISIGEGVIHLGGTPIPKVEQQGAFRLFFASSHPNAINLTSEPDFIGMINGGDIFKPISFGIEIDSALMDSKLTEIFRESGENINNDWVTWRITTPTARFGEGLCSLEGLPRVAEYIGGNLTRTCVGISSMCVDRGNPLIKLIFKQRRDWVPFVAKSSVPSPTLFQHTATANDGSTAPREYFPVRVSSGIASPVSVGIDESICDHHHKSVSGDGNDCCTLRRMWQEDPLLAIRDLLGPLPSRASRAKTDARGRSYSKQSAKPRPLSNAKAS